MRRGIRGPARHRAGPLVGVAVAAVLLLAGPLAAQEMPPDSLPAAEPAAPAPSLGMRGGVGAFVRAGTGVTMLRGRTVGMARVGAFVDLTPSLRVGAEGSFALGGVRVSPDDSPDRSEVRLGYGGLRVEARRAGSRWVGGLLLGAGTARVDSPLLGTNLDTRNFFLVEPTLRWESLRSGWFRPGVSLAGRLPLDAPSLVGVSSGDLAGVSLEVSLQLNRPPRGPG
jgi:hypothetical protein